MRHVDQVFILDGDAAADARFATGLRFAVAVVAGDRFDRFGFFGAFVVTATAAALRQRQILSVAVVRRRWDAGRHRSSQELAGGRGRRRRRGWRLHQTVQFVLVHVQSHADLFRAVE